MAFITAKDGAQLYYNDWGARNAQPIFFHHGWPLSADDWDNQMMFFLGEGYRVIAYDRRGHGRSEQTDHGNEMDTYASDVNDEIWNGQWPGCEGGPAGRGSTRDGQKGFEPRRNSTRGF
jgi:non-heme chloroperoxidase